MVRLGTVILSFTVLIACTAESQTADFLLRNTPAPPVELVFSEAFDNGLANWNQTAGTWTTGAPASSGQALLSPTSAAAASFSITTKSTINLSGKTGCVLQYEVLYDVGSTTGTAAKILWGSNVLADFKPPKAQVTVSSSSAYVTRRIRLPDNSQEKITVQTSVIDNTASGRAIFYLDNLRITCYNPVKSPVTVLDENFESNVTNWSLVSPWTRTSGVGVSGSYALNHPTTDTNVNTAANYAPAINLSNRQGCRLNYYFRFTGGHAVNYLDVRWNLARLTVYPQSDGNIQSGSAQFSLVAYEGNPSNQFGLLCGDDLFGGAIVSCTIDDLKIVCEE